MELQTDRRKRRIPASQPEYDLGVIAGNRSMFPMFSWILPGEDDGILSVSSTKSGSMTKFLVVPRTRPFLVRKKPVILQSLHFLEYGQFQKHP